MKKIENKSVIKNKVLKNIILIKNIHSKLVLKAYYNIGMRSYNNLSSLGLWGMNTRRSTFSSQTISLKSYDLTF